MPTFTVVKRLALDPNFEPEQVERFVQLAKEQHAFLYMEIRKVKVNG